jgi:hypothetical protein
MAEVTVFAETISAQANSSELIAVEAAHHGIFLVPAQ